MHIVYITHEYPKPNISHGGVGSFVQFIARALAKKGYEISVIGVNNIAKEEIDEDEGVKIYRVAKSLWKFGKFYQNNKKLLKVLKKINLQNKIDVVEGSELSFAFFPKDTTYKKLIRMHGGHHFFAIELDKKPAFWRSFQENKSFAKADYYLAVSKYVGTKTKKYLNTNFEFTTIYNSVDVSKFTPTSKRPMKNQLLFIGTICEKKGVRQLIMAMKLVIKEIPTAKLKVVGRDWFFPDGSSYINYLKGFIDDELLGSIDIVGPVAHEKIPDLLSEAELCVYPSHMEAMPIAWLEALAMEKAVVASNIGPGQEAIIDKKTGLLVNPHKPDDISEAIIKLFSDSELADYLSRNARKDILERFEASMIVDQNIEFYQSIINH